MYAINNTLADINSINGLFANSLYRTAASATPTGTTSVVWLSTAITATGTNSPVGRFATGYNAGKAELLPIPQPIRDANPNITQNPGY
jgi:hypothetical protein